MEFNRSLLRANSGEPVKKSSLWKYAGREMTEDEIIEVAKSVGLAKNENEIKFLAEKMIKEEKDKAWKILDTFANIAGYGYELHNGELDKVATKLAAEFIKKRDLIWRSQGIISNVVNIKRLISELEAAANEAIDKNITKSVYPPVPF
jgi:hypothetical protein